MCSKKGSYNFYSYILSQVFFRLLKYVIQTNKYRGMEKLLSVTKELKSKRKITIKTSKTIKLPTATTMMTMMHVENYRQKMCQV